MDGKEELLPGSPEEIEIRAATVQAVERMRDELEVSHKIRCKTIELDWFLWQRGEAIKEKIQPHHRTLTIFY